MRAPTYDERGGAFARLRGRRVFVYWPHGFGDFVHFGYVAPHLTPENVYRIGRFGDDFTHLYDGQSVIPPVFSGVSTPSKGPRGFEHLGVDFRRIRNREMEVALPPPLSEAYFRDNLDTILYTDYPEYEGRTAFPFHTKARSLLRRLVTPERLATIDLGRALRSALRFTPPADAQTTVDAALRRGNLERFVLIAPGGHTNTGKSWPAENVLQLQRMLARRNVGSVIVNEPSFAAFFAAQPLPFAHALLGLLARAEAFVGVAAGPLHAALAAATKPTIGIWSRHYPDWYDEPCAHATHFVSATAIRARLHERPATLTKPPELRDRIIHVEQDIVPPDRIDGALRENGV